MAIRGEWQTLFRNSWPADIATQPFQLLTLIRLCRYAGVQGESGYLAQPNIERLVACRQCLQCEDPEALLRSDGNPIGDR